MADVELVVEDLLADEASLDAVQNAFGRWWEEVDGDLTARVRLETAVVEIAGNIIEHARARDGSSERRYSLRLIARERLLRAQFWDDGRPAGLDLSTVSMADAEDESGRGLALALATLDRLDYAYENGRNVWTLECRIS